LTGPDRWRQCLIAPDAKLLAAAEKAQPAVIENLKEMVLIESGSRQVDGLLKMARHHVHLSADAETAKVVAARRGLPLVLCVRAATMAADGHAFFLAANGVWLTERVPPQYIEFPAGVPGA